MHILVARAYGVEPDQVTGPDYEVDARVADGVTREQFLLMQQRLLEERFHLQVRMTGRERVIDKTGLDGEYDFRLEFAGDPRPFSKRGTESTDPGGPTLFEALDKQLGLKLTKGFGEPADYVVIEHADRTPVEN